MYASPTSRPGHWAGCALVRISVAGVARIAGANRMPSLSSSPRMRSVPRRRLSRDIVLMRSLSSGLKSGRPPRERDFQCRNRRQPCRCQRTTRIRGHEHQVLAPAGTPAVSQHPEELVPGVQPSAWSGSRWPGEDGELMTQEQVLEDQVLTWVRPGQHGGGRQTLHGGSAGVVVRTAQCGAEQPVYLAGSGRLKQTQEVPS